MDARAREFVPAAAPDGMAAKRKIAPPKPRLDLPWSQLEQPQQNQQYTKALHAYAKGNGQNPGSSGDYHRAQLVAEAKR